MTNYYTLTQAFGFSYIGYSRAITIVLVTMVAVLSFTIERIIEGGPRDE